MPYLAEIEKLGSGAGSGRVIVVAEDEDGPPDLDALFAGVAAELPEGVVLRLERFGPRTSAAGNQAFEA